MITIRGIEIDFDITSPADIERVQLAKAAAVERNALIPPSPEAEEGTDDDAYLQKYKDWLNANLKAFGDFIDDIFGDGTAERLLTKKPSFNRVFEVNEDLEAALGVHVKGTVDMFERSMNKYKPNRATRRARQ